MAESSNYFKNVVFPSTNYTRGTSRDEIAIFCCLSPLFNIVHYSNPEFSSSTICQIRTSTSRDTIQFTEDTNREGEDLKKNTK